MNKSDTLGFQSYFDFDPHRLKAEASRQLNAALKIISEIETTRHKRSWSKLTQSEIAMLARASVDLDEQRRFLGKLKAVLKIIGEIEMPRHEPSRSKLTQSEIAMLERAGVDLDEHPGQDNPMLNYALEFAVILSFSLTTSVVAENLGETPARVRQMIRNRNLYAIRIRGRWHIPLFQFTDNALVPNISRVNQAIAEFDPVSVRRWITTPDPDLEGLTPLGWLKAGRDLESVLKVVPDW